MNNSLDPYAQYRKGYFKAILDIRNWLTSHDDTLKGNKINKAAGIIAILDCILTDTNRFMTTGSETQFTKVKDTKTIKIIYSHCDDKFKQEDKQRQI